jgi:hypothetical protein
MKTVLDHQAEHTDPARSTCLLSGCILEVKRGAYGLNASHATQRPVRKPQARGIRATSHSPNKVLTK